MPDPSKPLVGFLTPYKFVEAVKKLKDRGVVAIDWNNEIWSGLPVAIRDRAIWSAGVQSAKFVQTFKNKIEDFLSQKIITLENGETMFAVGGRSGFVKEMMEFIQAEGIPRKGPRGAITDIGSSKRLRLIFDTQTSLANEHGYWQQGNDEAILDAFPAQRFIRVVEVKVPRPLHEENEGAVRRKDDLEFWLSMNDPAIGGFGLPHGPWGFNSGMDVEDVGRLEAEALGLIEPGEQIASPVAQFNAHMDQSLDGVDPEIVDRLKTNFRDVVDVKDGRVTMKPTEED